MGCCGRSGNQKWAISSAWRWQWVIGEQVGLSGALEAIGGGCWRIACVGQARRRWAMDSIGPCRASGEVSISVVNSGG
jgi:hypothetical protein